MNFYVSYILYSETLQLTELLNTLPPVTFMLVSLLVSDCDRPEWKLKVRGCDGHNSAQMQAGYGRRVRGDHKKYEKSMCSGSRISSQGIFAIAYSEAKPFTPVPSHSGIHARLENAVEIMRRSSMEQEVQRAALAGGGEEGESAGRLWSHNEKKSNSMKV